MRDDPNPSMKPHELEKFKRENFINNLKNDNKIDSYNIKLSPVLKNASQSTLDQMNLHPSTVKLIDGLKDMGMYNN